jgi:hypothetical protein
MCCGLIRRHGLISTYTGDIAIKTFHIMTAQHTAYIISREHDLKAFRSQLWSMFFDWPNDRF